MQKQSPNNDFLALLPGKMKQWFIWLTIGIIFLEGAVYAEAFGAIDLSGTGWRLYLDPQAPWKNDKLFLPDEVDLAKLPVNPPSGGWDVLSKTAGIPVSLPATVEEYYWSRNPATNALPLKIVEHNGSFLGVSWWYRTFKAPKLSASQHCLLEIGGSRLRTEIYLNGMLVGYNIISELPFTVDVTPAIKPGAKNFLAIRITNPGGELAWNDTQTIQWGEYHLPMSHGFGGLDKGIRLLVRGENYVSDLAVLNTPTLRTIKIQAEITATSAGYRGPVAINIARNGQTVATTNFAADIPAGKTATVAGEITVPVAKLWDIEHPELYQATARLPAVADSEAQTTFGFRWFNAEGIGTNAILRLNGRRIVVRSSISWGFWAPNGMFPDDNAVAREIASVKALGLNSLQNHRHMPNGHVLDGFDRAGLLRYCEAGSGLYSFTDHPWADDPKPRGPVDVSGEGGAPRSFTARYEMFKILGMVRAFRSHPSVSLWTLQNEISPNLQNASLFWMLRQVHELDPSRLVVLKSGINPNNQALMLPYSHEVLAGDKNGYSGWWDHHTATDSKGVYLDSMYRSPDKWEYRSDNQKEIVCWGEMATGASPDNHAAVAAWYAKRNQPGYDRLAAETLRDSYARFLSKWGFDSAFPTPESLFREAGNKHYFSAARVMENARMSDPVDYVVLSGWESTIIDDHSGLVDALRNLKGDPVSLHRAGAKELLVLRPRHYVIAKGKPIVFDAHLINESQRQGPQKLSIMVKDPGNRTVLETQDIVTAAGGETYGQLLKAGYAVDTAKPGIYTVTGRLTAAQGFTDPLNRSEQILVVDPQPAPVKRRVAIYGDSSQDARILKEQFGIDALPLGSAGNEAERILIDSSFSHGKTNKYNFAGALQAALPQVRDGAQAILILDEDSSAAAAGQALANAGLVTFSSVVPHSGESWNGSWYFGRKHWLLDGLPANCVWDWQYQTDAGEADALMISGDKVEGVVGFGRSHDPRLGLGVSTIAIGKGQIIVFCLPGLMQSIGDPGTYHGIHPVTAHRLLYNALK